MVLLKKAQIETMGLVIIVIILVFVFIFALQFITKPQTNELNNQYLKLNADNLRSVILKTTISTTKSCNVKDEIINCNNFNQPTCLQSCTDLRSMITEIIENTIKNNYEFNAKNIKIKKGICQNNIFTSSTQPLALTDINVSVMLC